MSNMGQVEKKTGSGLGLGSGLRFGLGIGLAMALGACNPTNVITGGNGTLTGRHHLRRVSRSAQQVDMT